MLRKIHEGPEPPTATATRVEEVGELTLQSGTRVTQWGDGDRTFERIEYKSGRVSWLEFVQEGEV